MEKEPKFKIGQTVNSIYCQEFEITGYDPEARFFPYLTGLSVGFTEAELVPVPEEDYDFGEADADRHRDEARASIAELEKKLERLKKLEWLMDTMYRGPEGSR